MQSRLSIARLLIVQTGSTHLHGDYPRWFERALGLEMPLIRAHAAERLASALDRVRPQGRIVTGSPVRASNENTAAQAYRLSETVAGVQFHPELWAAAMRDLILSRRDKLAAEGRDADALAAQVHEVEAGALLRAFAAQAQRS